MDIPALLQHVFGLTDPEQLRAGFTGLFQMTGVFVTGLGAMIIFVLNQRATRRRDARLHEAEIKREDERRQSRVNDVQTAIRAEIRSHRERLRLFQEPTLTGQIAVRIRVSEDASDHFTPLSREKQSRLYSMPG